ncbi:chondroitin AC/alginate lyase [Mucidula mucida]|nr:chondroitin AC/alginate lyase [Mucidula mucida]
MVNYNAVHGDEAGEGFINGGAKPRKTSNWIKFGIPVAVVVIIAAVLGGVLGSRAANKDDSSSSSSSNSGGSTGSSDPSEVASVKKDIGLFPTSTNTEFSIPIYPSTTNAAAFVEPTVLSGLAWPSDSFTAANPAPTSFRPDRPRLIAPKYKWDALPDMIAKDPYMSSWNDTIMAYAQGLLGEGPKAYYMDGASGILDISREVKQRVKALSYAYRMTEDTSYVDRVWLELQNAAGTSADTTFPTDDKWNSEHFLDTAEMASAFGIAYDWLHDIWTDDQKAAIRDALNTNALSLGVEAYGGASYGWWRTNTQGNWNCVCNAGLTIASLAILDDDNVGHAAALLGLTIDNAKENCADAVSTDGTWKETPNYWYFGTTGHAEMASALLTATGSDYELMTVNPDFQKTGDFHMHVYGATSMFEFGDSGPNKFSSTANSIMFYAEYYKIPEYALFQRDRWDAAEPWAMFWYNPGLSGAYWEDKEVDAFFNDPLDQWVAMRSSWTDQNALYVAMKAGENQGHQTHNDLDVGDFVLDAMGTRWAGEFGNGDYLSTDYFSSEAQTATRWTYYRKGTEGQNTLLIGGANQNAAAKPEILASGSSGTKQGSSTVMDWEGSAFWVTDMTSAYNVTSVKRGVRTINNRRQVLIQDEVDSDQAVQWQMHTNATVSTNGATATLTRDGKTLEVHILSPSGASFSSEASTGTDIDQANPGITTLMIQLDAGTLDIQVLFNPQWDGVSLVTPPSVALADWSVTSHDQ